MKDPYKIPSTILYQSQDGKELGRSFFWKGNYIMGMLMEEVKISNIYHTNLSSLKYKVFNDYYYVVVTSDGEEKVFTDEKHYEAFLEGREDKYLALNNLRQ